jgi:hypothetical protein
MYLYTIHSETSSLISPPGNAQAIREYYPLPYANEDNGAPAADNKSSGAQNLIFSGGSTRASNGCPFFSCSENSRPGFG